MAKTPERSPGELNVIREYDKPVFWTKYRGERGAAPHEPMTTQTATFSRIALEMHAPIARITLRNSPVNVIDIPMMEELAASLAKIEAHSQIAVVLIAASQTLFSAAVDVAAHPPDKVHEMLAKLPRVVHT